MKLNFWIATMLYLLIASNAFGQRKFLNSDYVLADQEINLMVIPIYNEQKLTNDSLVLKAFEQISENIKLASPASTRQLIDTSEELGELINKIIFKDYRKKELKASPNLNTILTQAEIEVLRNKLEEPSLLMVPIAFNIKASGILGVAGYTFGYANFRLYDLITGEFIFECPNTLNVNIGGEEGAKGLTAVLIGMTASYFQEKLLDD